MPTELRAEIRTSRGKGPARRLRVAGKIPAVVYGGGGQSVALTLDGREFEHVLQTSSHLVELNYEEDGKRVSRQTLIKEIQQDPIRLDILHVDFHEVAQDTRVIVSVPIRMTGTPAGIGVGGVFGQEMHELDVSCLPAHIPTEIVADSSSLEIGDRIIVEDLLLPEGVTAVPVAESLVAHVLTPRGGLQEAETPEEAPVEGSVSDVEVIGESEDEKEGGAKPN